MIFGPSTMIFGPKTMIFGPSAMISWTRLMIFAHIPMISWSRCTRVATGYEVDLASRLFRGEQFSSFKWKIWLTDEIYDIWYILLLTYNLFKKCIKYMIHSMTVQPRHQSQPSQHWEEVACLPRHTGDRLFLYLAISSPNIQFPKIKCPHIQVSHLFRILPQYTACPTFALFSLS